MTFDPKRAREMAECFASIPSRMEKFPGEAMWRARDEARRVEEALYLASIPENMRDLPRYTHQVVWSHGIDVARKTLDAARRMAWDTQCAFELIVKAFVRPDCYLCKDLARVCEHCGGAWGCAAGPHSLPPHLALLRGHRLWKACKVCKGKHQLCSACGGPQL